jgi:serine/threonine protein kinase
VHLGLLRESDGKQVTVAVKKTKLSTDPGLSTTQRADQFRQGHLTLQRELSIMLLIGSHPNVLGLKGAITDRNDFCVVTEYCEYGSLDKFLSDKEKEGKFVSEYTITSSDGYQLTKLEFKWKVNWH